mmetsp:Transcript_2835/g.4454  ORF Transcript_2835/g.4454 Transcript_2835/m.4454 type:complete len:182 (+) Transcript_2835:70-615(+)
MSSMPKTQATESKRRALVKQVMDEHDDNLMTERAMHFIEKVEHRLQRGVQQVQPVSAGMADLNISNSTSADNLQGSFSYDMPQLQAASTSFASAFSAESPDFELGSSTSALDAAAMSSDILESLKDGEDWDNDKRRQYDKITRLRMARRNEETRHRSMNGGSQNERSHCSERQQMMKNLGL